VAMPCLGLRVWLVWVADELLPEMREASFD
jgi:hypothetical protein